MSRLEDNSIQIRNFLESRNLYTPNDPYNISGTETSNTINNIANVINPFSTTVTTIASRLLEDQTPLTAIGLEMLAKQFTYNAASNAAAEYLPAIKFDNLFDGDPDTKFIMVKQDFQITRRESQGNVGKILEEITGNYPLKGNPFTNTTDNIDYIKNSGKGQLQLLTRDLDKNTYKPSSLPFLTAIRDEGFNYGENPNISTKQYFIGKDEIFYPYEQYKTSADIFSINETIRKEKITFIEENFDTTGYLEYGANQIFIDSLGKTDLYDNDRDVFFNNDDSYGLEDDPTQRIVWGRDTKNSKYKDEVGGYDNPVSGVQPSSNGDTEDKVERFSNISEIDKFDIKNGGLLAYTRELLNTKGRNSSFDLTRKKFIDTDEQVHFNGSPLRVRLDGSEDKNRQHSALDPYDSFVKAIRYNGNKIYTGNQNSVVYQNVIPKIHPILDGNTINNKNMMFSIENLAFEVYADEENNYGLVQDDGSEIPICEVGSHGGRVMWFPPYDIQVNENIVVHHETTNFIGRGEPIYTYSNTERIANLSFKLLIDYPPSIKGMSHAKASRFFAFGGEAPASSSNLGDKVRKKEELIKERDSIQPTTKQARPDFQELNNKFYFINDRPDSPSTGIEYHYNQNYEINSTTVDPKNTPDGRNHDLNESFKQGINENINNYLINKEKRKYTKLVLIGSASALFNGSDGEAYNRALSNRRIDSIIAYIEKVFKTGKDVNNVQIFEGSGISLEQAGIKIERSVVFDATDTATDDAAEIPTDAAKEARRASVTFAQNDETVTKEVPITTAEQETITSLNEEIQTLETNIIAQKNKNLINCTFTPYTMEDGVLKGFESSEKNKYKPAFHSQTPEDFHRRLTFLHQCTRQGSAIRKSRGEGNTFSASNSVFGRQPVQILRIGDMFHTKVVIDNLSIDYSDAPWDMNPEGMGMQFMIADIKMQLKLVGGQSLQTPINALQNAVSFNFYANSTFYNTGIYEKPSNMEAAQVKENMGDKNVEGNPVSTPIPEVERVTEIPALNSFKLPNVSI